MLSYSVFNGIILDAIMQELRIIIHRSIFYCIILPVILYRKDFWISCYARLYIARYGIVLYDSGL